MTNETWPPPWHLFSKSSRKPFSNRYYRQKACLLCQRPPGATKQDALGDSSAVDYFNDGGARACTKRSGVNTRAHARVRARVLMPGAFMGEHRASLHWLHDIFNGCNKNPPKKIIVRILNIRKRGVGRKVGLLVLLYEIPNT